jgi:hypothetical protein
MSSITPRLPVDLENQPNSRRKGDETLPSKSKDCHWSGWNNRKRIITNKVAVVLLTVDLSNTQLL